MLQAHAAAGTEVVAEPTAKGPAAIESAHDAGLVVPELIRLAPLAEKMAALQESGARVLQSPAEIGETVEALLRDRTASAGGRGRA